MNLEATPSKKTVENHIIEDIDFEFKPITSGLGFHHQKTTEIRPHVNEVSLPKLASTVTQLKKEVRPTANTSAVYQNDLSLFYGHELKKEIQVEEKKETIYRSATSSQRVLAYILDLSAVLSFLAIVLTIMARLIHMDVVEAWSTFPHEITPLVLTLFVGFYLIYFSIFEKTQSSTIGKSMVGITVVNMENRPQNFLMLVIRSTLTLSNFISLGLFAYFDLQNKVSKTKVIKVN
jgi:uncharacterized RDD family membrane protein YckC